MDEDMTINLDLSWIIVAIIVCITAYQIGKMAFDPNYDFSLPSSTEEVDHD